MVQPQVFWDRTHQHSPMAEADTKSHSKLPSTWHSNGTQDTELCKLPSARPFEGNTPGTTPESPPKLPWN